MQPKMQAFLGIVPDEPLATILCYLPMREAATLALVGQHWRRATGSDRESLWRHLFSAKDLRAPSKRARRASTDLRRAFFSTWLAGTQPNINRLFYLAWNEFSKRDSPRALERIFPPPVSVMSSVSKNV